MCGIDYNCLNFGRTNFDRKRIGTILFEIPKLYPLNSFVNVSNIELSAVACIGNKHNIKVMSVNTVRFMVLCFKFLYK